MNPRHLFIRATAIAALAVASATASAIPIAGVTANADVGNVGISGTNIANTVNGVGLSAALDLNATHAGTTPGNSWVTDVGAPVITFDLGGLFSLSGFSFWNQNAGGPSTNVGFNEVNVLTSTDGSNFVGLSTYFFAEVLTGAGSIPEQIGFGSVNATHVRFDVISNHGHVTRYGFGEILFDGATAAPEPATLALLGLSLIVVVGRRRSPRVG